ncbi:MAG TPA: FAD-dependent oxidoreductase [Spirochaetales bacterium]|nr:FAD-dependent oxidoreductase [Spirochaetales bacterium]
MKNNLPSRKKLNKTIAIIGGGGTGCALAWDLSLRGFSVLVFEKGELTSGTTGRHHGQIHSGARYAVGDKNIARECMEESILLRKLVPEAVEFNGGIFLALTDEEADYTDTFIEACHEAGIPAQEISIEKALQFEPLINPHCKRCVTVPDGTFDAFRVPLSFAAGARMLGAAFYSFHEVVQLDTVGNKIISLIVTTPEGKQQSFAADFVINAGGAWAKQIAALAKVHVPVTPAPGTMVAVKNRFTDKVISRLAPPGDGDIIVPQRELSIIGSTQRVTDNPEGLLPLPEEISFLLKRATELIPAFSNAPIHAAWSAARPLAGEGLTGSGRSLSRDFMIVDHSDAGITNFISLIGGKATILRAMAEKAADYASEKLGEQTYCETRTIVPPSWRNYYTYKD